MKQKKTILIIAALIAAGMVSCQKEKEEPQSDFRSQWVGKYKSDKYTAAIAHGRGRYYDVTLYAFIPDDTCKWADTALFDREHIMCISAYSTPVGENIAYNNYFYGWIGEDGTFGAYYVHLVQGRTVKFNGDNFSVQIMMEKNQQDYVGTAVCHKVSSNVPDSVKHHIYDYMPHE